MTNRSEGRFHSPPRRAAKGVILDAYNRYYYRAPADHRAETNLDNHKCLHQALLAVSETLQNMELLAAVRELQPPPSRVLPSPEHPVIEGSVAPVREVPVAEESGIDLGDAEDEEESEPE